MSREELIELGSSARFGRQYHSATGSGSLRGNRQAVAEAVEGLSATAADEAIQTALDLLRSAREGTRMLFNRAPMGFSARSMMDADWTVLLSLADSAVAKEFPDAAWAVRHAADAWAARFFGSCVECAE